MRLAVFPRLFSTRQWVNPYIFRVIPFCVMIFDRYVLGLDFVCGRNEAGYLISFLRDSDVILAHCCANDGIPLFLVRNRYAD